MGCCQSSPSRDVEALPPARPAARDDTAATTANLNSQLARSLSSADSTRLSWDPPAQRLTGSNPPNKPIRSPSPLRHSPAHVSHLQPPWTRKQLDIERAAFFDTRVSGRQEIWNALRLVGEMLQQGDLVGAQGIMDAADITCPTGKVSIGRGEDRAPGGVYDERGELYELPAWLVTDPQDVVENDDGEEAKTDERGDANNESVNQERREMKGKAKAVDTGQLITLRARLSDRAEDVIVSIGIKERVATIIRQLQEKGNVSGRMRLVYLGHVLQESRPLDVQNYRPGDVVNAFVFTGPEDLLTRKDANVR